MESYFAGEKKDYACMYVKKNTKILTAALTGNFIMNRTILISI